MLYKYYRYILILKIVALFAGGYMLFSQWSTGAYVGGTSILVFSGQQQIDPYAITTLTNTTPGPWSLLRIQDAHITLHVPWTYDTGYILQYLRNGFPIVDTPLTDSSYFTQCKVSINVLGLETTVTQCQKYGVHTQVWAILFVILGFLL